MADGTRNKMYGILLERYFNSAHCVIIGQTFEPDVENSSLSPKAKGEKGMPTQEERLAAVEWNLSQFKTETVKAYHEMAMEVTVVKGLAETTIGRLATMQWQIDKRFNVIEATLSEHTIMLNAHASTLNTHTAVLNEHTAILKEHTVRFDRVEAQLVDVGTQLADMRTQLAEILARLPEKA